MKEIFSRLGLLLWKNWIIQKRRRKRLIGDIAIPLFIGIFLLYVRHEVEVFDMPNTQYEPFSPSFIPSMENLVGHYPGANMNDTEIVRLLNSTSRGSENLFQPFLPRRPARQSANPRKWKLIWSPDREIVNSIMRIACEEMDVEGSPVKDAATLERTMTKPSNEFPQPRNQILAGVVFPKEILNEKDFSKEMKIKIRFPAESRFGLELFINLLPQNWLTGLIFPVLQMPEPREIFDNEGGAPGYYREGFLGVENAVSSAIFQQLSKKPANVNIILTRFPYPEFTADPMIIVMQQFLSFLIVISFLFSVKTITEKITTEKERRLKIIMNIMGLSDSLRWASWYIYSMIFFSVLIVILLLVFKIPIFHGRAILPGSDWSCLAVFFLCYSSAATTFCFLISTIFSKAGIASTVSGMTWFLMFVPFYVIQTKYVELDLATKCISSLLLNTGMGIGMHIILKYEGLGPGIQWDNIWKPAIPEDEMTVALSLVFIMIDCIVYICIAFYIDNVFPGEFGTPFPWYYPFQRSYWFRGKVVSNERGNAEEGIDFPYEKEPENLTAGIQIKNLRKVYGKSKKPAIHNLSLNAFEGQITVLMGFNGAGKTTTLSILTGIHPPTSGTALVSGYDIATNMKDVRKHLGFCPQYNILFEELNVKEHIQFYGKLKGLNKEQIQAETEKYISILNLQDKSKTLSMHLSGGMKRKLSVALAMCGDTKVLIFDEPTAGMDPRARRSLWDLLIAEKKGRTILITTHFLDEANLLGDRVAIMSEGKLNCCGSTFFLKKQYSCGYHLKIIKTDNCDITKVTEIIRSHIPEDVNAEDVGMELSYRLPDKHSDKFEKLFRVLENEREQLEIIGFGVAPTTLEDVFINLSDELAGNGEQKKGSGHGMNGHTRVEISDVKKATGFSLLLNQIKAMFYKHLKYTLQSWKSYILLILLAVCGISNAIFTIRINNRLLDLPPRDLVLEDFPNRIAAVKKTSSCKGDCDRLYSLYSNVMKKQDVNIVQVNETLDMENYLLQEGYKNSYLYRTRHILGTTFDVSNNGNGNIIEINGWFNALPYHTTAIALSNIYNAVFHTFLSPDISLTFTNEPLPYKEDTKIDNQSRGVDHGFRIGLFIAFTYIFIASFFILFPIQEREVKAKLLQIISDMSVITFWLVALTWNLFMSIGPNLALIITLVAFQEKGFREIDQIALSGLILMSFFFGSLPLLYLGSLMWSKPALGFILSAFFNIITGIFSMLLVAIMRIPELDLVDIGNILDWIFSLFPLFSMGRSFQNMNTVSSRMEICQPIYETFCLPIEEFNHFCCKVPEKCPNGNCLKWTDSYLDWDEPGFGRYILFSILTGIVALILLFVIESRVLKCLRINCRKRVLPFNASGEGRDSDVLAEREKVLNLPEKERQNYNLIIDGVSKKFAKCVAVNNLYLAVREGECFGLLGANGAGKTTTFKILTGDDYPTSGNAYVKGLHLTQQMKQDYILITGYVALECQHATFPAEKIDKFFPLSNHLELVIYFQIRRLIGYCPQFDALIDELTGREHLRIYCLIRGIKSKDVNETSLKLARELLFEDILDKKVKQYSGGNKRKLSTAIAFIGNPPIVYLDEPTAGIDPVAKRHLWAVINKHRSRGNTVILTSHSMEECETLCTRLTIMVKGEFKCLGTAQYLKNKYCEGYSLKIKIKKKSGESEESENYKADTEDIENFISQSFPGAIQTEKHEELLVYQIPYAGITLSKIFGLIESVKENLNIEDYSVGQTTLEQILLKLTGAETDGDN